MSCSPITDPPRAGRAAFSLLEVVVATALLGLLVGLALQGLSDGATFTAEATTADSLRVRASATVAGIAQRLRGTQRNKLRVEAGLLGFHLNEGWDPAAAGGEGDIDWSDEEYVYTTRTVDGDLKLVLLLNRSDYALLDEAPLVLAERAVESFTVTDDRATDGSVTITLALREAVGRGPGGAPHQVTVTVSQKVFVRPDPASS